MAASQISGVGRPRLNLTKIRRLVLPVPPRDEQDQIVVAIEECLSRLNEGVRLIERALVRTASARRALTSMLFKLDDVPWTTLGAIADIVGGVTKDSKRQSDPSFVEVPYLRVANVQRGFLDLTEITTIRVSPEKACALRLEPGDILFNEGGDRDKLGRGWVWDGQIDGCIHQNHVFRARLRSADFEPRFVSLHGNSFGKAWFEQTGKQTTNLASISRRTLTQFPVPAPPLDIQRNIVARVETQSSLMGTLDSVLADAMRRGESLRRSILSAAFRGALVNRWPSALTSDLDALRGVSS
jgi:type I restriction enzyme S subunit